MTHHAAYLVTPSSQVLLPPSRSSGGDRGEAGSKISPRLLPSPRPGSPLASGAHGKPAASVLQAVNDDDMLGDDDLGSGIHSWPGSRTARQVGGTMGKSGGEARDSLL